MGCCGKEKKKIQTKDNVTKKNKVEKKKNSINNKEIKTIDDKNHQISSTIIEQNPVLKLENNIQQETIQTLSPVSSPLECQIKSPSRSSTDYELDDISPSDNISSVKTIQDLQMLVEQHNKPISIVLFYGRYCPYSKRTIPGLRQWARLNKDRIFLYEADVEQASQLAEYYHVRTIPTIMAFEKNYLLAPIWQRTADNVLPTMNESEPIPNNEEMILPDSMHEIFREKLDQSKNIFLLLDSSVPGSNRIVKINETPNENQQEQYLILLDDQQSMVDDKSKLLLAITNEKDQKEVFKTINRSKSDHDEHSKSIASSEQSSYIWNRSTPSLEERSLSSIQEYNGRMISQSTISSEDQWKKVKRIWNEQLEKNLVKTDYQQHIYLPNSNEIFYEKHYDETNSSSDRFSTLTYQHVQNMTNYPMNQEEEICVLYLGPNRCRGFEDDRPIERNSSKLSLLTLKSHSLSE